MLFALQLLAQAASSDAPAQQGQQGSPIGGMLNVFLFVAIGFFAWFFLIRPMRRQEQERQALVSSLKKNDRVVTSGGIIGTVANIKEKEDEVMLKLEEGRMRVTKSSIVRILGAEEAAKDQKNGGA